MDKLKSGVTIAATSLWMLSTVLMVVATALGGDPQLAHWSLLVGLWACTVTGWGLLDYQRVRVETIARLLGTQREAEKLHSL
jgi:hypothetical protein